MNIVVPCGGLGERFTRDGYHDPKPLIPAMGKPVLFWMLDGLVIQPNDAIVVAYSEDLERWRIKDRLRKALGPHASCLRVVHLAKPTRGAAETVAIAMESAALTVAERQRKTVLLDCDTFYHYDVLGAFRDWPCDLNMSVVFRDEGGVAIYSYCDLDDEQRIRRIKEKDRISPWANTGCYSFASGQTLLEYCLRTLATDASIQLGEFYTSSVISAMLGDGQPFRALPITSRDFVCLGTPLQLRLFCATGPSFAPRRVCFDLDGTLITHPLTPNAYDTVQPYTATIEYARYLKNLGNTIIIQTARGMRSCGGNLGLLHVQAAASVHAVLERFAIPCDELYFGKPHADVYIDDLAHNVCEDLQKATGFYQTTVAERSHNLLEGSTLRTLIKRSSLPLDGEIHWYTHIPPNIRHFFPAFIRAAADATWYEVERLESTTCSNLYVNECLTPDHLRRILGALRTIHESAAPPDYRNDLKAVEREVGHDDVHAEPGGAPRQTSALIYANYAGKLVQRYASYDYSQFPDASTVYNRLLTALQAYEDEDRGVLAVVHGDPVLSNILMERGAELRFIDMRGKQGAATTIFGDMWYDYAKVFQSLSGYDEILLDRRISSGYRERMMATFVEEMTAAHGAQAMGVVRLLAASLFLTLIPLHNNEKCQHYYDKARRLMIEDDQALQATTPKAPGSLPERASAF